ncbi:MAG TPA: hypothetical protein VHX86_08905 [Tepidisphaeraceae bacterium]|jgi:hypothetical protein|nr:hypothetical protein [Tepidisphaeraceae bacterium]
MVEKAMRSSFVLTDWFRYFSFAITLAAVLAFASPPILAGAASPATQPADAVLVHQLGIWITQLASDDSQTRQGALDRLMDLNRQDLPALRAVAMAQSPLLPGQVALIRQVVTQVFLAGQPYDFATDPSMGRGFIGLSWEGELPIDSPQGVIIKERLPGFVGYRMLQPGDVLVKILREPLEPDIPLHQFEQFTNAVRPMQAGELLRLEILRYGKRMDISFQLDRRPLKANQEMAVMRQWLNDRAQAAEEYWTQQFSAIDPSQTSPSTQP